MSDPLLASEQDERVALRHYTSISNLECIEREMLLRAGDGNRVFAVRARGNPMSARDAERALGIRRGRGNAYIDFLASPSELTIIDNPLTGATEHTLRGDVDLSGRNPTFHVNR